LHYVARSLTPGVAGGSEEKALQQAREIGKRNTFRGNIALAAVYRSQDDDQIASGLPVNSMRLWNGKETKQVENDAGQDVADLFADLWFG
jgi:hypothetical protein